MRPPTALSIAAADPTGADGIAADLKTFTALGVYGTAVVSRVLTRSAHGAQGTGDLPAELVRAQLAAVLDEVPLDATKIGLLGTSAVVEAVADVVAHRAAELGRIVLDVELVAASGEALSTAEAAAAMRSRLLPLAHVLIAGLPEAAHLLGEAEAVDLDTTRDQALRLRSAGPAVVVLSGGVDAAGDVVDVVAHPGGVEILRAERVGEDMPAGARSTLSAAIAAQYARIAEFDRAGELGEIGEAGGRDDDLTIVLSAHEFLASAIENAQDWELSRAPGRARGAVNHLITLARD